MHDKRFVRQSYKNVTDSQWRIFRCLTNVLSDNRKQKITTRQNICQWMIFSMPDRCFRLSVEDFSMPDKRFVCQWKISRCLTDVLSVCGSGPKTLIDRNFVCQPMIFSFFGVTLTDLVSVNQCFSFCYQFYSFSASLTHKKSVSNTSAQQDTLISFDH